MPIYDMYPYSNLHELNLDWVLKKVKELEVLVSQAMGQDIASTIIFANPIQWDASTDYGRYNLVLDNNYSAYLSTREVPAGTLLSDTVYWQPVGNFAQIMELVLANIAYNQLANTTAEKSYAVGDLLILNELLYIVTSPIMIGYTIDPGTNVTQTTIDALISALNSDISTINNDIGTITNDITTINNDITTINNDIGSINNDISTINSTLGTLQPQVRIKNHFRYYIDGVNGNDDNNGLSSATAFKTIDKFFSMSSQYSEIRGYIISAGTYTLTLGFQMSDLSVHLTANVAGVIIELPKDVSNEFSIYACHMNLKGVSAADKLKIKTAGGGGRIYSDNVAWSLTYVDISDDQLALYGSTIVASQSSFKRVYGNASLARFYQPAVTNEDPAVTPWEFQTCQVTITGTTTSADLTAAGTVPYLIGQQSYIVISSVIISSTTNKYTEGLKLTESYLNITSSRLSSIGSRTQNGNIVDTANGNNVFNPS